MEKLKKYDLILASGSPRRKELLKGLDLEFRIIPGSVDESYPEHLQREKIATYLAEKKAGALSPLLENQHTLLITADTIVWLNGENLGKPSGREEALEMLRKLSGKTHEVITGVCLLSLQKKKIFYSITRVDFRVLDASEIEYYIDNYQPFDKAGAYGIQEWIGYTGITSIEGSYFNVVGLPVQELYHELLRF